MIFENTEKSTNKKYAVRKFIKYFKIIKCLCRICSHTLFKKIYTEANNDSSLCPH